MKTQNEDNYLKQREKMLQTQKLEKKELLSTIADNFPKYASRQQISRFLVRHEMFKLILDIKGSIIECGVFEGCGLMTWAQLSATYEPVNYNRMIIGFDTFQGFPAISQKDKGKANNKNVKVGGLYSDSFKELNGCIEIFDQNRILPHMPKVKLVKGDFSKTGKKFLVENKHLLISLLYMDFDIYKPTREALEIFLPRMSKGSILAFDQINNCDWPGETLALIEKINLKNYKINQFYFDPNISYIVL